MSFSAGAATALTASTISITRTSPADPAGILNVAQKMLGLALTVTPSASRRGIIRITITGGARNDTAGDRTDIQLRWGTGAAPANGDAATGTQLGGTLQALNPTASGVIPFTVYGTVDRSAAFGTAIWIDISIAAAIAGTSSLIALYAEVEDS